MSRLRTRAALIAEQDAYDALPAPVRRALDEAPVNVGNCRAVLAAWRQAEQRARAAGGAADAGLFADALAAAIRRRASGADFDQAAAVLRAVLPALDPR